MDKIQFRNLHSGIRKQARERALRHGASVPVGNASLVLSGFSVTIAAYREARGNRVTCEPARVYYPTIVDRHPRSRMCEALKWAKYYRDEARKARGDKEKRSRAIYAAIKCICEARTYQTAFISLP